MELDLNELERLSKSATPGPWRRQDFYSSGNRYGVDGFDGNCVCASFGSADAGDFEFIAAANPVVVLELVRRLRDPWQPMESAPKDGTAVLALLEGSDIPHPVRWVDSGWRSSWDGYCIPPHDGPLCWMAIPAAPNQPPKGKG